MHTPLLAPMRRSERNSEFSGAESNPAAHFRVRHYAVTVGTFAGRKHPRLESLEQGLFCPGDAGKLQTPVRPVRQAIIHIRRCATRQLPLGETEWINASPATHIAVGILAVVERVGVNNQPAVQKCLADGFLFNGDASLGEASIHPASQPVGLCGLRHGGMVAR